MEPVISNYLNDLKVGEPGSFHNLEIFPLTVPQNGGPAYLTLKEALAKQSISILEINDSGSVPQLKVLNKSDDFVLLLDGEELMGAKQNRVLNTSVLIKGQSETVIPVSCTEQGRWSYQSPEFHDSDVIMACRVRSEKFRSVSASLMRERRHSSDQGAVWDGIAEMQCKAEVESNTGAMKDVFDARKKELDGYMEAFTLQPDQQGILVYMNGKACGLDLLSKKDAFSQVFPKLIKSYAMDALLEKRDSQKTPNRMEPAAFLAGLQQCRESRFESPGVGYDYRYEGNQCVGSVLVYEEHPVHLAFFGLDSNEREAPMAGFQRRRQFRRRG
jgi:hypothetical protein